MATVTRSKGISFSSEPLLFRRSPIEKRKIPVPANLGRMELPKKGMDNIRSRQPEKKSPPFSIFLPKGKILNP